MGESFEILFWLAVFVIFALRGATRNRSKSTTSRPAPRDDGEVASGSGRRGIFADLMQQIEAQVEAQRRDAERRAGEVEAVEGEPGEPEPSPAETRRRRVDAVRARAHPADRRAPPPHEREGGSPGAGPVERPRTLPEPRPPIREQDRDREREHVPSAPEPTYVVPGRRVHAPGTVAVGRSPEAASALSRGSGTTPIGGAGEGEDVRVERVARASAAAGGLARFDRYSSLRRAILLSEVLAPPPGLTGRPSVDRRMEKIG